MHARVAAAFLAVGLLTGCAHGSAQPVRATGVASAFNGTDLAWIEVNIAMDEQVLPLLTLAGDTPAGERGGAAAVRTAAEAELTTLRALHDRAGLPASNPHEGMPMPGMVTAPDLARMRALTGPARDRAVAAKIHEYLEQGLNLAGSETAAGAEPQTVRTAAAVAESRHRLLTRLPDRR